MLIIGARDSQQFVLCVENEEVARITVIAQNEKLRLAIESVPSVQVRKPDTIGDDGAPIGRRLRNPFIQVGVTIPAEQVTVAKVVEVLHRASLPVQMERNGDILVVTDDQPHIRVILEAERLSLRLLLAFGWRKNAAEIDKLWLLNTLNQNVSVARFAMPDSAMITADQCLPYHDGLSPSQLVNALRVFKDIVLQALRRHDTAYLVC